MGTRPRALLVVSYFRDGSTYPRAGRRRGQADAYWSAIAVQAATLRHVGAGDPEFLVYAGDDPSGLARTVLEEAGAEIRHLPFASRPPDDFFSRYLGSLYVLDVMRDVAGQVEDDAAVLFVDPDMVWVRPLEALLAEVRRGGVVAYELDVPEDVPLCELSRRSQGDILAEMADIPAGSVPVHFGGEFYGLLGRELRSLVREFTPLWEQTLSRYQSGKRHFHVEEHVLNAALLLRGEQSGRANAHLQRVMTLPAPFGTRERATSELASWHLPHEKHRGFLRIMDHLSRGRSLPPPGPAYVSWMRRVLGIDPGPLRRVSDIGRQLKWVADGRLGRAARAGRLRPGH